MPAGADLPGTSILQYRVIDRLGSGGMGDVYLAEDTRLGRGVALKFLAAALDAAPEARARLVREAQVAAQLRSPHIAVAYDLVEHETGLFIAMEYVEGELVSSQDLACTFWTWAAVPVNSASFTETTRSGKPTS